MVTEIPRSTLLGLPRIFFAGGLWRHFINMPMDHTMRCMGPSDWSRQVVNNIKAGEYCNEMNRVGRDNLQP